MTNPRIPPNPAETPLDILKAIKEETAAFEKSENGMVSFVSVHRVLDYCDRLEAAIAREKRGAKLRRFDFGHTVEDVLRIGRDFQNTDRMHGAHYDTVKLLCDTIEDLNEQLFEAKKPHPLESQT